MESTREAAGVCQRDPIAREDPPAEHAAGPLAAADPPPRKESRFLRAIAGLRAHESQRLPARPPPA